MIEVATLDPVGALTLRGPGIDGQTQLGVGGLPADFWPVRAALAPLFPRGIDIILCSKDAFCALPRSLRIGEG